MNPSKTYVAIGGIRCPSCGAGEIRPGAFDVDVGAATQGCTCLSCGATWRDCYELVGFDQLEVPVPDRELLTQLDDVVAQRDLAIGLLEQVAPLALARFHAEWSRPPRPQAT